MSNLFDLTGRTALATGSTRGLGLALARGLARDLGGDLTLADAAGGGACFRRVLPGV